jgi:hypothetical protein
VSSHNFDQFQFAGRAHQQHPVHADFDGHDYHSNGIAWEDYSRMSTHMHKLSPWRRGAAPEWVFNNTKLRAVIVGCIEARANNGFSVRYYDYTGTDAERLARAMKKLAAAKPNLEARIDKLCRAFLDAKYAGRAADEKELAQKVEETDTQLRMIDEPAKYYAGVAYHYWRSGLNSVETGQQLGLKPPHIRCLLWRMGKIAGQLGYDKPKTVTHKPGTAQHAKVIVRAARELVKGTTNLKQLKAAAVVLDPHKRRQKENTNLIPYAERLPLVVKMYRAGARTTEIAAALGWRKNAKGGQEGYGMVKRLLVQAGLRKA